MKNLASRALVALTCLVGSAAATVAVSPAAMAADNGNGWRTCVTGEICFSQHLREVDDSETQGDEYYPYGVRHFYYSDPSHHNDYFNRASPYTFPFWDAASAVNNRDTDCYVRVFQNVNYRTDATYTTFANHASTYRYKDINRELDNKNSSHLRIWCG